MVGKITTLGSIQKIPEITNTARTVAVGTTRVTIYTCPAGKKATIKQVTTKCDAFGANTEMYLRYGPGGTNRATRWLVASDSNQVRAQQNLENVGLAAGDVVQLSGDAAANNGEIDYSISVLELSV